MKVSRLMLACVAVQAGLTFHLVWPRGYKTFLMLNSAEHEISTAHKYSNSQNQWNFQVLITKASHLSC